MKKTAFIMFLAVTMAFSSYATADGFYGHEGHHRHYGGYGYSGPRYYPGGPAYYPAPSVGYYTPPAGNYYLNHRLITILSNPQQTIIPNNHSRQCNIAPRHRPNIITKVTTRD